MPELNLSDLAAEFLATREQGGLLAPPSGRYRDWSLADGYRVGHELVRLRRQRGWQPAGRKVGFTNKSIWPAYGMDTVIWAYIYNRTVSFADLDRAELSLAGMASARIEPEIVFKLKDSLPAGPEGQDAADILAAVEWLALGYEVVDCNYPDWQFKPPDAVADFGLHAALIVGRPQAVTDPAHLAARLQDFRLTLYQDGRAAAHGRGSDVLDSPALALGWLARTLEQQAAEPLKAGEIITTGTITAALPVEAGQEWRAEVEGLELPPLTLRFI